MNMRDAHHILFLLANLVVTGCATVRFDVTVEDQTGETIDHRTLKVKDLPVLTDEMYSALGQGDYEKCRGLAGAIKEVWPSEQDAVSNASRLSAWATLFQYRENPTGLTTLENEKRNLFILRKASSEFAEVTGPWVGEAETVAAAIHGRLLNRAAFNAFVKAMRASANGPLLSREGRVKALASVTTAYPDWSRTVGLGRLAEYPWKEIAK